MNATVSSKVLEEYGQVFQPGSVILLKDVTVISPSGNKTGVNSKDHHYLNITVNVLLATYSSDENGRLNISNIGDLTQSEIRQLAHKPPSSGFLQKAVVIETENEQVKNTQQATRPLYETISGSSFNKQQSYSNSNFKSHYNNNYITSNKQQSPSNSNFKYPINNNRNHYNASSNNSAINNFKNSKENFSKNDQNFRPNFVPKTPTASLNHNSNNNSIPQLSTNNFSSLQSKPKFTNSSLVSPKASPNNNSKFNFKPRFNSQSNNSLASNNINSSHQKSQNSISNNLSKTEEKEVNEFLKGVDLDALFDDF